MLLLLALPPFLQHFLVDGLDQSLLVVGLHHMLGLPGQQRLEPILDRVLIPFILQFLRDGRPLLPVQPDKLDQEEILLLQPVLLHLRGIQVVQPPLPALLRRPEEPPLGLDEERLPEVAPLQPEVVPADQLLEETVLLMDPLLVLVVLLQQVLPLVHEELLGLGGEELGEEGPIILRAIFGLHSKILTKSWISIAFPSA